MHNASRICFFTAIGQLVIAVILIMVAMKGLFVVIGTPPMAMIAGVLFITGTLTLIAGAVIGTLAWRRQGQGQTFAILNIVFALGMLTLTGVGLLLKQQQDAERAVRLEEYTAQREREQEQANHAGYIAAIGQESTYQQMLWQRGVVLVPSKRPAAELDSIVIGAHTAITFPVIDIDAKFAAGVLLGRACRDNVNRLLLACLQADDRQAFDQLAAFLNRHECSVILRLDDGIQSLERGADAIYERRQAAIAAIEAELH